MNILIVKLGAAGDVLRTTSLLPGLKLKYPKSSITWIVQEENRDILVGNPHITSIYSIESIPYTLRKKAHDLIICLDEEPDVCHLVSQLKTKKLIGTYMKNGVTTYTPSSAPRFDMSRISKLGIAKADLLKRSNRKTFQELCAKMLGISYKHERPFMYIPQEDQLFASRLASTHNLQPDDLVIGVSSSAGKRWPNKRLSIPESIKLINLLHRKYPKAKILLLGGPDEAIRNSEIHSQCPQAINVGCHHTMKRFASIVNLCSTVITSDSFTLHIATALQKRIIAFFGPTSPHEIDLYGNGVKILPKSGCVSCFRPKCIIPLKHDIQAISKAV